MNLKFSLPASLTRSAVEFNAFADVAYQWWSRSALSLAAVSKRTLVVAASP